MSGLAPIPRNGSFTLIPAGKLSDPTCTGYHLLTDMEPTVRSTYRRAVTPVLRGLTLSVVIGVVFWAGCEVPESPEWDVELVTPISLDTITVEDLLPAEVGVATINGQQAFTVVAQQDSIGFRLAEMCEACRPLHGLTFEVPGFDYVDSLDVRFPTRLRVVELIGAFLTVQFRNELNFDPLRPDPDPNSAGFIAVTIRDLASGTPVDSTLVGGDSTSFPPGSTTDVDLALSSGTELTGGFRVIFRIHSPADGQTVQIDTTMSARFAAAATGIAATAVTVLVDGESIDERFVEMLDPDVREEIQGRLQEGAYQLLLDHNVEIQGGLEASIAGSEADLFSGDPTREIRLGPLTLESGLLQSGDLDPLNLELLASFDSIIVAYRGKATGTRTGRFGLGRLTRLTPGQFVQARFKLLTRIRVGG